MPRLRVATVLAIGSTLPACPAPEWATFATATAPSTGEATAAPPSGPPATTAEPVPTTTVEPLPDSTSTTTGSAGDDTTAAPVPPPKLLDVQLTPNPLHAAGEVAISVVAEHTDEVHLQLDGVPVPLVEDPPGVFTDKLAFYTSLSNKTYEAIFTPWRPDTTGLSEPRDLVVELPAGGGEVFWEAIDTLGEGSAAALAVLPGGDLVEFGTLNAGPQCYLRRRAPTGAWTMDDVQILPEKPCQAIDLGVGPGGALYLLADRTGDGDLSWWLGRIKKIGSQQENLRFGAPGEAAHALAMHPESAAVCGTQPTKKMDVADAATWIFNFNAPGSVHTFDYQPGDVKNRFKETPRDCAFANDLLVLVGEAYGKHDLIDANAPYLDRLFLLEYDTGSQATKWTVDGDPKDLTQSAATSIAIDNQGRYITGGHRCGFPCDPMAELRVFSPGGAQVWQLDLAPQLTAPRRLAWSPAGYVVLVSSVKTGLWTADYFVQAWKPGKYPAVWSYDKNVAPPVHMALTVAVGLFGQVYTGGIGANNYPAVAFIHG